LTVGQSCKESAIGNGCPLYFSGNCGTKFAENVGQVANAYRSKHMRALSRPAVIQTCLSSSATTILIRPEELRIGLLGSYQVFQLFEAHKRPVFKDFFRHVNPPGGNRCMKPFRARTRARELCTR
jgi:hypothetical protein